LLREWLGDYACRVSRSCLYTWAALTPALSPVRLASPERHFGGKQEASAVTEVATVFNVACERTLHGSAARRFAYVCQVSAKDRLKGRSVASLNWEQVDVFLKSNQVG